jgi:hypothetical protein
MLPLRIRRSAGLLIITLSMLMALAIAAPVAAKNPPGNNGTVKIDQMAFDDHPNNEPHVDCKFQVDFYGFDKGDLYADVIFELQSPTASGRTMTVAGNTRPFIGEDDNSGAGSAGQPGLDASVEYTLAFTGAPHPQQGYHVKLTILAEGFQHGQGPKHKVFWVEPCVTPVIPPPPPLTPLTPLTPSTPPTGGGTLPGSSDPVRSGTAAGSSGPIVVMLPNTAMETSAPLALLAGMVLLGGSATLAVVEVKRERSRRR